MPFVIHWLVPWSAQLVLESMTCSLTPNGAHLTLHQNGKQKFIVRVYTSISQERFRSWVKLIFGYLQIKGTVIWTLDIVLHKNHMVINHSLPIHFDTQALAKPVVYTLHTNKLSLSACKAQHGMAFDLNCWTTNSFRKDWAQLSQFIDRLPFFYTSFSWDPSISELFPSGHPPDVV